METRETMDSLGQAQREFGVDLNDDRAVLVKMHELGPRKSAEISRLSNLWARESRKEKS